MPALITGGGGQLGRELYQLLPNAAVTDEAELDITDAAAVQRFDWPGIDAIYNAAAFTNVDSAEQQPALAGRVNHVGPANLALAARQHQLPLVQVSTDYVFDGRAHKPYLVDTPLNPQGVYGKTKAAGEAAAARTPNHYIVRTSWLYGDGANFVRSMLRLGRERSEVAVVSDQCGRPTLAADLAQSLVQLVQNHAPVGIYHCTNSGAVVSWADFATTIFGLAGIPCRVKPITTAEYTAGKSGIAPRPAYSALDLGTLEAQHIIMPDWHDSLKRYINRELSSLHP